MLSRKNHGYKVVILLIGILILAAIMDLSQIKLEENQLPREEVNGESVEWDRSGLPFGESATFADMLFKSFLEESSF